MERFTETSHNANNLKYSHLDAEGSVLDDTAVVKMLSTRFIILQGQEDNASRETTTDNWNTSHKQSQQTMT